MTSPTPAAHSHHMPLSSKLIRVTTVTTSGTQAVTGIGFQPKALIIYGSNSDTTGIGTTNPVGISFGFCDEDLNQGVTAGFYADGLSASDAGRGQDDATCFGLMDLGAQWRCLGEVLSLDSDGFTIDWSPAPDDSTTFNVLALGGSSLTGTKFLTPQIPGTGSQSYTGAGFQPDVMLMAFGGLTYVGRGGHGFMSMMMATEDSAYGMSWAERDNVTPTTAGTYHGEDHATADVHIYGGSTPITRSEFTSLDADGFTLDHVTGGTNQYLHAMLLKVEGATSGITAAPTTTGEQAFPTEFIPSAMLFMGGPVTADHATGTNTAGDIGLVFGASDGNTDASSGLYSTDSAATSDTSSSESDSAYQVTDVDTTLAAAEVSATGTAGFTLDWTAADASNAYRFTYLAMGAPFAAVSGSLDPTNPTPVVKP